MGVLVCPVAVGVLVEPGVEEVFGVGERVGVVESVEVNAGVLVGPAAGPVGEVVKVLEQPVIVPTRASVKRKITCMENFIFMPVSSLPQKDGGFMIHLLDGFKPF